MAIQFLKVTLDQAVEALQESARKGYAIRHAMRTEHDAVGASGVTDTMVADWIKRVNDWANETRTQILTLYESPNFMYRFLETIPNTISVGGQEQRFYNLTHQLLQMVSKLDGYVDFIIQNSHPTFSIQNNVTLMHLNPERDLNVAGNDVKTTNEGS